MGDFVGVPVGTTLLPLASSTPKKVRKRKSSRKLH